MWLVKPIVKDDLKFSCSLLFSALHYFSRIESAVLTEHNSREGNDIACCIEILIVDTGALQASAEKHATRVTSLAVRCNKCG